MTLHVGRPSNFVFECVEYIFSDLSYALKFITAIIISDNRKPILDGFFFDEFVKKFEMCLQSTQYECNQQSLYIQKALQAVVTNRQINKTNYKQ